MLALPLAATDSTKHTYLLYVGTYTEKDSKGIYAFRYDASSGKLTPLGLAAETANPSFLAISPAGGQLYAVNELQSYQGANTGAVSAFSIDGKTGKLTPLNTVASHGADPCHISFDRTGKYALVANYTGGTVAVLPLLPDGRIVEASSILKDAGGRGPNKERQDAPHAHWIEASADNSTVYVADLGLDRVLAYGFDAKQGVLNTSVPGATTHAEAGRAGVTLAPGTGPRHAVFSRARKFLYVLGELDSAVTVFSREANGALRSEQHISALPRGFTGHNDAAEIAMHRNGRFLYTSNRGDDSIAVFSIDSKTGRLELKGHTATQGKTPRHFEIDPTGKRLFVANQESDTIVVFAIDEKTGALKATGVTVKVPSPVCLKFVVAD